MAEQTLLQRYLQTRGQSVEACKPLGIEDFGLQAEAFTSPPKWHLAHTSWFFETFLLMPFLDTYRSPNDMYQLLFNSYYNSVGEQFPRPRRGLLSRPTVDEVMAYRTHVDSAMSTLLGDTDHPQRDTIVARSRLGIAHEEQHQELFYTDLKYSLSANPLLPTYRDAGTCALAHRLDAAHLSDRRNAPEMLWREYRGELTTVGLDNNPTDEQSLAFDFAFGFAFDNEGPPFSVYLEPFALANRLVTNAEFQAFIDEDGYRRPEFWLADAWALVEKYQWRRPLYWLDRDAQPMHFTLHGLQSRLPDAPACHLSGYEADAYACWAGARLPTEHEWEYAAAAQPNSVPSFDPQKLQPSPANGDAPLLQLYGECWQWTGSAYRPYPRYKPCEGAVGEYNGKFMANQWVLRGGSCVTPSGHVRPSYRNFFYPHDRWQFSGVRLAKNL